MLYANSPEKLSDSPRPAACFTVQHFDPTNDGHGEHTKTNTIKVFLKVKESCVYLISYEYHTFIISLKKCFCRMLYVGGVGV